MFKRFPLSIQLFAEGNGESGSTGAQGTTPASQAIDYAKIEEIVNKRSESTADSVLKGYLKQQGLTGDELNQAVADFKAQKEQAQKAAQQESENIRLENQQLKAQILNSNIDSKLTALASAEGVQAEKVPFLLKLANREGLTNDKGEIVEEKVKASIQEVLKAFPDFKTTNTGGGNGFSQIGSSGNSSGSGVDAQLDAIFGVGKK